MKNIIITCAMFAGVHTANAQSPGSWDENTGRTTSADNHAGNKFSGIEMEVEGRVITFTHVPDLRQDIVVVITDAGGNEITRKGITPLNRAMDIRNLRKGKMYFVTLLYNDKSQKGFVLHPE